MSFYYQKHILIKVFLDVVQLLYRRRNTRFDQNHIQPVRRSGRISIGFVGWIASNGVGELVEVTGHFNSANYIEILRDSLLRCYRLWYGPGRIILVHDRSAVHTSRATRDWLVQNARDFDVILLPAKSPDMNPIEHVWARMVKDWPSGSIRTTAALRTFVNEKWEQLRLEEPRTNFVKNLYNSMTRRFIEIVRKNGGVTRY